MNLLILFCAKYLLFVSAAIAGIFFLYVNRSIKRKIIWLGLVAALVAFVIAKISAHFIYDARPFVVNHIQPLIQHAADNGFPSDHMLVSTLIALIVFTFNKKISFILMVFAILTGAARILALIHHPLDIIGSILIALISIWLAQYVLKTKYFHFLLNQLAK